VVSTLGATGPLTPSAATSYTSLLFIFYTRPRCVTYSHFLVPNPGIFRTRLRILITPTLPPQTWAGGSPSYLIAALFLYIHCVSFYHDRPLSTLNSLQDSIPPCMCVPSPVQRFTIVQLTMAVTKSRASPLFSRTQLAPPFKGLCPAGRY